MEMGIVAFERSTSLPQLVSTIRNVNFIAGRKMSLRRDFDLNLFIANQKVINMETPPISH